jgi:hypothetical protein
MSVSERSITFSRAQRDCRKTNCAESPRLRGLRERPISRVEGGVMDNLLRQRSVERPVRVDLADIVYQGERRTHPLYIHFQLGP